MAPIEADVAEAEDTFPSNGPGTPVSLNGDFTLDMTLITNSARPGPPSVATTELASTVGSVVGKSRDAFLKSVTFYTESGVDSWAINLKAGQEIARGLLGKKTKPRLFVDSVGGIFALSRVQQGDYLRSINDRKVGPSLNPERALERTTSNLKDEGYLTIETANKELGDDILIQATIIKPSPEMTYEDMGMVVWYWGFLCIKSISKDSIFSKTCLKSTDQITSINDILCENMKPEQFAEVLNQLPYDVTLTVLRRKQRWIGHHT